MAGKSMGGLDIIVGAGRPKSSMKPSMGGDDDENMFEKDDDDKTVDDMLVGAADGVLSAMHSRDPEELAMALKSFMQMV